MLTSYGNKRVFVAELPFPTTTQHNCSLTEECANSLCQFKRACCSFSS